MRISRATNVNNIIYINVIYCNYYCILFIINCSFVAYWESAIAISSTLLRIAVAPVRRGEQRGDR